MSDIETRFRAGYDKLMDRMPNPPPFETIKSSILQPRTAARQRPGWLVAGVSAVAVFGVVGLVAWLPPLGNVAAEPVTVDHMVVEFEQEVTASCSGGEVYEGGQFDSYTIETWAEPDGGMHRAVVTYPDGSTFEVVGDGNPPSNVYARGEQQGRLVGCIIGGISLVVATPQDDPFHLAIWADVEFLSYQGTGKWQAIQPSPLPERVSEVERVESLCDWLAVPEEWLFRPNNALVTNGVKTCTGDFGGRFLKIELDTSFGVYAIGNARTIDVRRTFMRLLDAETRIGENYVRREVASEVGEDNWETKQRLTVVTRETTTVDSSLFATDGMTLISSESSSSTTSVAEITTTTLENPMTTTSIGGSTTTSIGDSTTTSIETTSTTSGDAAPQP
ncbi:MAG: hypothetical protein WD895_08765 [Acidimicrobiia bacterium]